MTAQDKREMCSHYPFRTNIFHFEMDFVRFSERHNAFLYAMFPLPDSALFEIELRIFFSILHMDENKIENKFLRN